MVNELEQSLLIPVQLVPMEELSQVLNQMPSGTVVTHRWYQRQAEEIATPLSVRVIPVDIYDYAQEIELIKNLPKNSCVGMVSLSAGLLRVAEVIIHSLRGEELRVMTAQLGDVYKLNAIVKSAQLIISDRASFSALEAAVQAAREDIIRPPKLFHGENYIGVQSINLLKRELGLG